MQSQKVRVLVVDDSAFIQRAVERMIAGMDGVEVVGVAADGMEAVRSTRELQPDVVLLDINMPHMDGLEALETIMAQNPTRVILMSTLMGDSAETTMRALELGAVDFIDKSRAGSTMLDIYDLAPVLRDRIMSAVQATHLGDGARAAADAGLPSSELHVDAAEAQHTPVYVSRSAYRVVVVGASTGGPRALTQLLSALPAEFPAPVLVAQHMPSGFTAALADRLHRRCALPVREAQDGDGLEAGSVLIGPGGHRLWLERQTEGVRVRVAEDAATRQPRPSVDELFTSAAAVAGAQVAGVVLTGMGDDGAVGLRQIRDAGGLTIVESEETAVIYGMPREARASAMRELPLRAIVPALLELADADPTVRRAT